MQVNDNLADSWKSRENDFPAFFARAKNASARKHAKGQTWVIFIRRLKITQCFFPLESLFLFYCLIKSAENGVFCRSSLVFPTVNWKNGCNKIGVGVQMQLPRSGYCQRTHWAVFLLWLKNAQVLPLVTFFAQIPQADSASFLSLQKEMRKPFSPLFQESAKLSFTYINKNPRIWFSSCYNAPFVKILLNRIGFAASLQILWYNEKR